MIKKSNLRLQPEAQAGIRILCNDFTKWANKACRIRTKEGDIRSLSLNTVQARFKELYDKQMASEGRVRIVVLKARQQGFSTLTSAMIYHSLMHQAGKKGYVVAHKADSTASLFDMYKRIHEELPAVLKPDTKYSSRKELSFPDLNTSLIVATAGGSSLARGETLTHVHASEVAFWPMVTAKENMNALLQAVPDKGSVVIVESTANGMSGTFYDLFQGALDGTNGFLPFFSAWFDTFEYRRSVPDDFEATYQELDLIQAYGLDNAQLMFRREKVATSGLDAFEVEYPSNAMEAFKASGASVFPIEPIREMQESAAPLLTKMAVQNGKLVEFAIGELFVYKKHSPSEIYSIGADVAEGIINKDRDYSVAQIYDGAGFNVATWRGQIDPLSFAEVLDCLGHYYNDALIACEKNSHGFSTNLRLNEMGYPKIFTQIVEGKITEEPTKRLGFVTGKASKDAAIDRLRESLRERSIKINDPETLKELSTYISTPTGRMLAQKGCHDDCVMALAICIHVLDRTYPIIELTDDFYSARYW